MQIVKGQGHMRPKIDLVAWWKHRSHPFCVQQLS